MSKPTDSSGYGRMAVYVVGAEARPADSNVEWRWIELPVFAGSPTAAENICRATFVRHGFDIIGAVVVKPWQSEGKEP